MKSRDGKPLTEFEVAAADGKFVPAEATIDGDTVVVQAKEVATPTQARFGWRQRGKSEPDQQGGPARLAVPDQQLAGRYGRVSTI